MGRIRAVGWILLLAGLVPAVGHARDPEPEDVAFFEQKIRPVLVEHCFACHHPDHKIKGGLRLDTREGWSDGGDSGPAIEPGKPEESFLLEVISYDSDLKMPPKGKLPEQVIADFRRWIGRGAADPRTGSAVKKQVGLDLEAGRQFWAYQPPQPQPVPVTKDLNWPQGAIDSQILAALEAKGLQPAPAASREVLCRRVYFDLIGLPPTPEVVDAFVHDPAADAYERLVDRLLASPQFGERWGRHWLDVARYADSLTLRGFVFPNAWRYRDYVIDSFNRDRPFDRFIVEQIAGDLLPAENLADQQQQRIATSYLVLGNTNLEEQDKAQLRMDVVDEQLDTIGKGFLAQTIGCARCHDHKFDPIPTRDYYALAGILKSTRTLEHANVSNWLEIPLPVTPAEEDIYQRHEQLLADLAEQIKQQSALLAQMSKPQGGQIIAAKTLPGVVVDDSQAKRVGMWQESQYSKSYIGDGYIHDQNQGKGEKTLTFLPELPQAGVYEVRLAYTAGDNRSEKVPVTVMSADGEKVVYVDEKLPPPQDGHFISLGQFRFELNGQGFVIVSNAATQGHVIADAVQFLPVGAAQDAATAAAPEQQPDPAGTVKVKELQQTISQLKAEQKRLTETGPKRPTAMSVKEEAEVGDTQIHIRGVVHNLGATVPRGFLQVTTSPDFVPTIADKTSGRRELGEWIASRENPLTARVFVNRVWHWLFGAGLVRSTDNFGTTGELPSHPALLDHLALDFMDHGWSVKHIVRQIVLSQTYRQSSAGQADGMRIDPENRLLWHASRRRLDAECLRDSLLLVSGRLNLQAPGSTIKPGTSADYGYQHADLHRSVYQPVFRNTLPEIFEAFDFADPSLVTGVRNVSTVVPQSLYFMNSDEVLDVAGRVADRLIQESHPDVSSRIVRAYRVVLGRSPTPDELRVVSEFIAGNESAAQAAWSQLIQALLASPDFRYVE